MTWYEIKFKTRLILFYIKNVRTYTKKKKKKFICTYVFIYLNKFK
jgi:hypothetical protein